MVITQKEWQGWQLIVEKVEEYQGNEVADLASILEFNLKKDFCGIDLSGWSLRTGDFRGADLRQIKLNRSNLGRNSFLGADFGDSTLCEAHLFKTDLKNTKFEGANLQSANFRSADLKNSNLKRANLNSANFCFSNLDFSDLEETNAKNTNFLGARLNFTVLVNSNLERASFKEANLRNANLSSSSLIKTNFEKSKLGSVNFSSSALRGANFMYANLNSADFRDADLTMADFRGADLSYANFYKAKIEDAIFDKENPTIAFANFDRENFETRIPVKSREKIHLNASNLKYIEESILLKYSQNTSKVHPEDIANTLEQIVATPIKEISKEKSLPLNPQRRLSLPPSSKSEFDVDTIEDSYAYGKKQEIPIGMEKMLEYQVIDERH